MVSFAGELLKKAEDLLHTGLHTSEILAGYKTAFDRTLEILPTLTVHTVRSNPRLALFIDHVSELMAGPLPLWWRLGG